MWISVKEKLPKNQKEVLVSDGVNYGYASYAVAWYHSGNKKWYAATDLLEANNYDGRAIIEICEDIKYWHPIEEIIINQ